MKNLFNKNKKDNLDELEPLRIVDEEEQLKRKVIRVDKEENPNKIIEAIEENTGMVLVETKEDELETLRDKKVLSEIEDMKKERKRKEEELKEFKKKQMKRRMTPIMITVAIIILMAPPVRKTINNVFIGREPDSSISMVIMPDLTNVSEKNATDLLDELGIKYKIITQYDKYTDNGNVIKSNANYGSAIRKGEKIILYISEKDIQDEDYNFKDIEYINIPSTKSGIVIEDIGNDNEIIKMSFRNERNKPINSFEYTMVFYNASGYKIGSETRVVDNIELNPGERIIVSSKISKRGVFKIEIDQMK